MLPLGAHFLSLLLKIVLFGNIDVQTGFGGASDRGQWGGVDLLSK